MSEFREASKPRSVDARVVLACAATALLASGCAVLPHSVSKFAKAPVIPRCFTKPQPKLFRKLAEPKEPKPQPGETWPQVQQKLNAYFKKIDAIENYNDGIGALETLTLPVHDGFTDGDPIYVPGIDDKVDAALVEVEAGDVWKGTGFLTTDNAGHRVVVTAAHVVDNARMHTLTITNNNSVSTHPIGGCYIYEDNGHFKKLDGDERPVDIDIAVLRLPKKLGSHTLKLSQKPVKRGQWLDFGNYQGLLHEPGYPANYTGVVVSKPHDYWGMQVLTGAQKLKVPVTVGEVQDNIIQGGASGGPVTDLHGEVVGISVAGDRDGTYTDGSELKALYDVVMPGAKFGDKYGFVPETAQLTPASIIAKALSSRRG